MTYTRAQRARYVELRLEEMRRTIRDAQNEAGRMEAEELRAHLDLVSDAVTDALAATHEIKENP